MLCLVSQPNHLIIEVEVDQKANGQECLEKACQILGIIEEDYFGLQFQSQKGETLWLNIRNRIDCQLQGLPPYRFLLRVKFFVEPHFVLQNVTRHQFYLQVKQELLSGVLHASSEEQLAVLIALLSQAEDGNQNQLFFLETLLKEVQNPTEEMLAKISTERQRLGDMSKETAKYEILKVASEMENYGVEFHAAKNDAGDVIKVGVGPGGILIYGATGTLLERIEYPVVDMATHSGKFLILNLKTDADDTQVNFKLVSQRAANALYRCVTEMHSFFRCDTVRNAVSTQYSRDLKGTLASIFYENTTLGKSYVFDIKRTCREAYDHARRTLYKNNNVNNSIQLNMCPTNAPSNTELESKDDASEDRQRLEQEFQLLKEKLESYEDSCTCPVCFFMKITCVLCPCGHAICNNCASKLDECPLCREKILNKQVFYLPTLQMARL